MLSCNFHSNNFLSWYFLFMEFSSHGKSIHGTFIHEIFHYGIFIHEIFCSCNFLSWNFQSCNFWSWNFLVVDSNIGLSSYGLISLLGHGRQVKVSCWSLYQILSKTTSGDVKTGGCTEKGFERPSSRRISWYHPLATYQLGGSSTCGGSTSPVIISTHTQKNYLKWYN